MADVLGVFEQVVLLRQVAADAVYATLDRLEEKSLISSRLDAGTAARGGRSRRYYTIENVGLHALNESKAAVERIWPGFRWPWQVGQRQFKRMAC